jgi:dipeptidyl-peptidase 4
MYLYRLMLLGFLAVASSLYLNGQAKHGDPEFMPTFNPHWLSDSSAFWYRRSTAPGKFEFVIVNATTGESSLAFNQSSLANGLRKRGRDDDADSLPFDWIDVVPERKVVRFRLDHASEATYEFIEDGDIRDTEHTVAQRVLQPQLVEEPSLDLGASTAITFVNKVEKPLGLLWIDTEGNAIPYGSLTEGQAFRVETTVGHVWRVEELPTEKPIAVYKAEVGESIATLEDNPLISNQRGPGTAGMPSRPNAYKSPNGKFSVQWQHTPAQSHPVYMVESTPKDQFQPKLKTISYLKPGDKVAVDRPRMFTVINDKEIDTSDSLFSNPWSITNIGWNKESTEYRFLFNERGHQHLRILGMSTEGKVRTIIEDSSPTFLDYSSKLYNHIIPDTDEMIWMSERDGRNHLYRFNLATGSLVNQITKGDYIVRSVDKVDDKDRIIWFRGYNLVPEQDHYHAHLARVNFDGSRLQVLTQGDGTHTWTWSPDRSTFTDTYSRVDAAPMSVLRNGTTGAEIRVVERGNLATLLKGTLVAERFVATGRDGVTKIYGIIIKPRSFDANKKYPVIEQIYAGPQDFFVPKAFGPLSRQRELADQGFVVIQIDGMGTNWREKKFHDVAYKNLKDSGFLDRIAWMKAAASTRPWMDLSRIGIYGGSAGGQSAAGAVLFYSDFYKAAAADSGCHDNRMDKIWWNEQWMGFPVDKSYNDSSNAVHAVNLKGALWLAVGELDTNVDPASTMQLVAALNKAGKDYELFFVPGGGHGSGSSTSLGKRKQNDFFKYHLLGKNPPERNIKGL